MALIIQFTNSAPGPVQQRRGPGRHPRIVVRLSRFKRDKNISQWRLQSRQDEVDNLRGVIKTCEQVIHNARYELAALTQSMEKGLQ